MMWFTLFLSTLPRTAHGCAGLFASLFPSSAPSAPSYPAPYTPPYVPPPAPPPFIPPPSFPAPLPPGPPIPPPPLPPPIFPQGPIVGGSQFGGNGPMPPLPGFPPMGLPAQGQFPGLQSPPQFSIPQGNFQQGLQGGIMQLGQVPQPLPLPFNSGGQGSSFSNQNNQGDGGGGGGGNGNGNGNGNQGGGGGGFGSQIANQGGGGGGGGPIQPPEPQFMDWCYDNSGGQPPTGNPNCFVNSRGFQCCNREMDSFLEDLASTTTNQVRWRGCNIQRMVTDINKHSQERFNLQFETFVGSDNVCGRHNVLGDWMCKTRLADGKVIMVYAHPVSNGFNLDSYGKTQLLRNGTNYVLPH